MSENKTQDNLMEAFTGESQANRKYLAYSKKAEKDGKLNAAKLFKITEILTGPNDQPIPDIMSEIIIDIFEIIQINKNHRPDPIWLFCDSPA